MKVEIKHAKILERNFTCYQEIKDAMLLLRLRRWRLIQANSQNIPAFRVLHNSQLYSIVKIKPKTLTELTKVKGFGCKTIEKYGIHLIININKHFEQLGKGLLVQ
jgi:ribonuclease D